MTGGIATVRRRDDEKDEDKVDEKDQDKVDEKDKEGMEGIRTGTMGGRRSGGELPREIRLIVLKVFDGNMACKRALIEIIY